MPPDETPLGLNYTVKDYLRGIPAPPGLASKGAPLSPPEV